MVPISLAGSNYNKQILLPFLTYQDPIYGIKIQYPSDWEKIQADGNFIIGFVSSSKQVSGLLPNLMITVLKSHSPSTSLNDFGNARISNLESQYHDFHLVSSGSFTDPGLDTWTATVDYGDGSGTQPLALSGQAFSLNHSYGDNGVYTITITITDDDGGIGVDTAIIIVNNVPPTVDIGPDIEVFAGDTVDFSGTFSDPG